MTNPIPPGEYVSSGFRIREVLGAGGFGITYLCTDVETGDNVAIKENFPSEIAIRVGPKLVKPKQGRKRDYKRSVAEFLREAYQLRDLPQVPSLIRVRKAFERNNTAYCVMDYIKGQPLSEVLPTKVQNFTPFTATRLVQIAHELAIGLQMVHNIGVIHGDVKPGNVMIRQDSDQAVLIDFGCARSFTQPSTVRHGYTERYAPVEAIHKIRAGLSASDAKIGPFTDVFSFGVLLYLAATGKMPPTAQERFDALKTGKPDPFQPVAEVRKGIYGAPDLPSDVLRVIDDCLRLRPSERPQSMEPILSSLKKHLPAKVNSGRRILQKIVVQEFNESPSIFKGRTAQKPQSRSAEKHGTRRVLWWLVVIAAAVLLAFVTIIAMDS